MTRSPHSPIWRIWRKGATSQKYHASGRNYPESDPPHTETQGSGNFFLLTRMCKGLGWGTRLASFIFQTRVIPARAQERYQFTKKTLELNTLQENSQGCQDHCESWPSANTPQNRLPNCCSASAGLATPRQHTCSFRVPPSQQSPGLLHHPGTPWLSPFLGPYYNLQQRLSGTGKESPTPLLIRGAKIAVGV